MKFTDSELRLIIKEELHKVMDENLGDYVGYTTWIPGTENPMDYKEIVKREDNWWYYSYVSFQNNPTSQRSLTDERFRKIVLNLIGNYVLLDKQPNHREMRRVADEILLEAANRGIVEPYQGTVYRGVLFNDFEHLLSTLKVLGANDLINWIDELTTSIRQGKSMSLISKMTGTETSGQAKNLVNYTDLKPNARNDYFLSFSSSYKIAASYATGIIRSAKTTPEYVGQKIYHFPCVLECEAPRAKTGYLIDTDWMSYETNKYGTSGALDEVLFVPSLGNDLFVKRIHVPVKQILKAFKERKDKDRRMDPHGYFGPSYQFQTFLDLKGD